MSELPIIVPGAIAPEQLELPGATARVLCESEQPQAIWMIVEHAPGSVIPRHKHSRALEWAFVLSGSLSYGDGLTVTEGNGFAVPPGVVHGPLSTQSGCRLLVTYIGELDFLEE